MMHWNLFEFPSLRLIKKCQSLSKQKILFILIYFLLNDLISSCWCFVPRPAMELNLNDLNGYHRASTLKKPVKFNSRVILDKLLASRENSSSGSSSNGFSGSRMSRHSHFLRHKSRNNGLFRPIINNFCFVDLGRHKVACHDLQTMQDLPQNDSYFGQIMELEVVNISSHSLIGFDNLQQLFPNVKHLSVHLSPQLFDQLQNSTSSNENSSWDFVHALNISWNRLSPSAISNALLRKFPNLREIDLSHNHLAEINLNTELLPKLNKVDVSYNPIDCTSNLDWLDNKEVTLLRPSETLCEYPPHQNKAKPILDVLPLIKKVRTECRVNCSCDITYIWEQNNVIHSKTIVNCSNQGFTDFPDPDKLPNPTDTLDMRNNKLVSVKKFAGDGSYMKLHVKNLYLDNNKISTVNPLEGSEWFYSFQLFTIRNNSLTEVPTYLLENVFSRNKHILQIDLSMNPFLCECSTVSTFKIWLLKYASNIKNAGDVRCSQTSEQIRHLRREDWCTVDYNNGDELIDILDIVSILLALAIIFVVGKVYYDYWNFKHKGKLPWLVRKM